MGKKVENLNFGFLYKKRRLRICPTIFNVKNIYNSYKSYFVRFYKMTKYDTIEKS